MKRGSILESVLSLAAVQAADYLVPLICIPYLLRVIGASAYGQIALAQAVCAYFLVLVEYGFNYSGTKAASVSRHDASALSAVFWNVHAAKLILVLISAFILLISTLFIANGGLVRLLWIGMLTVLGNLLYPLWFLQAMGRMRECAIIMLSVRTAFLVMIFLFVKSVDDQPLAAALLFAPTVPAGLIAMLLIYKARLVQRVKFNWHTVSRELIEGRHTFFATAASSLYRSSNAVVIGIVSTSTNVAYYAIAEKIVRAVQELIKPLTRATYPRISALAAEQPKEAIAMLGRLLKTILLITVPVAVALALAAPLVMRTVGGSTFMIAAPVLQAMAVIPAIGGMNSVLGLQTMVPFGFAREFSRLVLTAGVINMTLIFPLVYFYGAIGAGAGYLTSELYLLVAVSLFLRSNLIRKLNVKHL